MISGANATHAAGHAGYCRADFLAADLVRRVCRATGTICEGGKGRYRALCRRVPDKPAHGPARLTADPVLMPSLSAARHAASSDIRCAH